MKIVAIALSLFSVVAFAGNKSELEPKKSPEPGYVHAGKTSVSKGKDKEQTVKEGAGEVKVGPSAAPKKASKTAL